MELLNRVAVVTGGASGLGEAAVRCLVGCGAKVTILDLVENRGRKVAEELGSASIFSKADINDENKVREALDKTIEMFGRVEILVNCAGVSIPGKVLGKEGLSSIKQFERVVQVNLIGTMNVIRLAATRIVQNDSNEDGERGVVINTASVAAFEGQIGQAAYSASKAGIVGMTLPIAREFSQHGIRVVTIAPGLFMTPMLSGLPEKARGALIEMTPFPRRLGKPSEFARLVREICENPMLNGCTIRLDGALRMSGK